MWKFVLVFWSLVSTVFGQNGYEINGRVALDDAWNPVIYLSLIEAFDELTTISGEMIIGQAQIDSTGNYSFSGTYLPQANRIYRVHVCKKGDPISTIIIGGREHNHVHFAMKPGDVIGLDSKPGQVFGNVGISGNPVNQYLVEVNSIIDNERASSISSTLSARLKGEEAASALVEILESSEYALGKCYAAYHLLDKFDNTSIIDELEGHIAGMTIDDSPYYDEIVDLLEFKVPQSKRNHADANSRMLGLALVIPVAFLLGWWLLKKNEPQERGDPLNTLSVQERKVFLLLADGLSNKEISSELSIGVSTVKSHIHRIYKKLEISSRKDVYKYKAYLSTPLDPPNLNPIVSTTK